MKRINILLLLIVSASFAQPTVTVQDPTDVSSTSAKLKAKVNLPNGWTQVYNVKVYIHLTNKSTNSTTEAYTKTYLSSSFGGEYSFSKTVTDLSKGTNYEYYASATEANFGTVYSTSGTKAFTTATDTLKVPAAYSTIQAGLNAATSGDVVLVSAGTYSENIIWPDVNGIKLISAGDSSNTIIDGGGTSTVIYMNPSSATIDTTTLIQGFKITNGGNVSSGGGIYLSGGASPSLKVLAITNNNSTSGGGGGIYISNQSSPYLRGVSIYLNSTTSDGGGIYSNGSNPTLTDVKINNNSASDGGGVYLSDSSNISIMNVSISGNTAGQGGGIYSTGSNPTLTDVKVNNNSASNDGGGLMLSSSSPKLTNVDILENSSGFIGGGMYLEQTNNNTSNSVPIFDNVIIKSNSAVWGGGGILITGPGGDTLSNFQIIGNDSPRGGGMYFWGGIANTISNVSILDNTATTGGGIYLQSGLSTFINITISGNSASTSSSGIHNNAYNYITISNSNITNNGSGINDLANETFSNAINNYWGDSSGPYHSSQNASGKGDSVNTFVNVDPWLTAPNTDAPPIPAQNLKLTASTATSASFSWDASKMGDIAGYKFYYDTDSSGYPYANSVDLGNVVTKSLTGLTTGKTYYVAVSTYDTDGNESWYSKEVSVKMNNTPVIAAVSDVTINEEESSTVTLSATDADGDAITYSAVSDTNAVTISVSSATLTLTPKADWDGVANIKAYASDGNAKDSTTFKLTVTPVNQLKVPSEYSTIQAGLNAAGNKDTVLVAVGTYTENIIWPDVNGIRLMSAGDSSNTIIDGGGISPVIYMNPQTATIDTTTLIQGFKITNGGSNNGVHISNSSPKITNTLVSENNNGIYIYSGSPTLVNIYLSKNVTGLKAYQSNFELKTSIIRQNSGGGGIYIKAENGTGNFYPKIYSTSIINNTGDYGGGVEIRGEVNGKVYATLNNVTIANNTAYWAEENRTSGAGGLFSYYGVYLTLNQTTIRNNSGIGIYPRDTELNMYNSEVLNNEGIGAKFNDCYNIVIKNSIFSGNDSYSFKVESHYDGDIEIDSSVFDIDSGNGIVISAGADKDVTIKNSTIILNRYGHNNTSIKGVTGAIDNVTYSTILTFGNNAIDGSFNTNYSNLINNSYGFRNNDLNNIGDATNNYWGDSSGPYHPTQNASGKGDSVNAYVNVDPWLTAPNTDAPPIPAQNLKLDSQTVTSATFSWDASKIGDLSGYKIYYDTDSSGYPYANSVDLGNVVTKSLTGLTAGKTYYVAVSTYDTDGNESWYSKEVSVTMNNTPVIAAVSDVTMNEDESSTVTLSATDVENDAITYSAVSDTSAIDVSVTSSALKLSTLANWNGVANIKAYASDGYSKDSTSFKLTVTAVNDAPVISAVPDDSTNEETEKAIVVSASDVEGDALTYSASSDTSAVGITVSSDTLKLTPGTNYTGIAKITVVVSDNALKDTTSFNFKVININDSPVISTLSDVTINEDETGTATLSATDIDGDALTYSAVSDTNAITVTVSSVTLTLTPTANWHGVANIKAYASDGSAKDSTSFKLTVTAVNDAPTAFDWVSSALDTVNITQSNLDDNYNLQWGTSTDAADGDAINYLLYAKIGVNPPEEIYDTTSTSVSITYEEFLENVFEPFPMLPRVTVKFTIVATDGIDTVNVTGDDRVVSVNRYEYLSTADEGIPTEFALHDNYPNPFNPTTTLRFDLPEVSNITLTIYNMLGQKVRTFDYQNTSAGYHSVTWDATNDLGQQVGAGVYLYQLQAKDFVKTRKMVLLK